MSEAPARVLVVAAHSATRTGIRVLLERGGFVVAGEAASAQGGAALALKERPELCVVHGEVQGGGVAALGLIKMRVPAIG